MNRSTSLYLDLVRFLAAVVVVLTHLAYPRFSGGRLDALRGFGNDAVMVFFVLSGWVIAHAASEREKDLRTFTLHRFARLWSVALPAIVLTLVLDRIGIALRPEAYGGAWFQDDRPWLRVLTAATFTNELWFSSTRLFSNGPYWSLGYEFWYYALFAAAWYLRGAARVVVLLAAAAIAGPKILLLLPVWALGVGVQRWTAVRPASVRLGLALWAGSILAYAAFRGFDGPERLARLSVDTFGKTYDTLRWSNEFLSSFVIGPIVALHFAGFHGCSRVFEPLLARFERTIRGWAGATFSIYLFHLPLMQCLATLPAFDPRSPLAVAALFASVLLGCRLLSLATEAQKHRARDWLRSMIAVVRPRA